MTKTLYSDQDLVPYSNQCSGLLCLSLCADDPVAMIKQIRAKGMKVRMMVLQIH